MGQKSKSASFKWSFLYLSPVPFKILHMWASPHRNLLYQSRFHIYKMRTICHCGYKITAILICFLTWKKIFMLIHRNKLMFSPAEAKYHRYIAIHLYRLNDFIFLNCCHIFCKRINFLILGKMSITTVIFFSDGVNWIFAFLFKRIKCFWISCYVLWLEALNTKGMQRRKWKKTKRTFPHFWILKWVFRVKLYFIFNRLWFSSFLLTG